LSTFIMAPRGVSAASPPVPGGPAPAACACAAASDTPRSRVGARRTCWRSIELGQRCDQALWSAASGRFSSPSLWRSRRRAPPFSPRASRRRAARSPRTAGRGAEGTGRPRARARSMSTSTVGVAAGWRLGEGCASVRCPPRGPAPRERCRTPRGGEFLAPGGARLRYFAPAAPMGAGTVLLTVRRRMFRPHSVSPSLLAEVLRIR
jgi:hypothetical protein